MRFPSKIQEDHLEKYQTAKADQGIEKDIILHFKHYRALYANFSKVFLPLVRFALYMNISYSYLLSSEQAKKTPLKEFVEESNDYKLEELYTELKKFSLNASSGLKYLYDAYSREMDFKLGCEVIDGVVEKYCSEGAAVELFLIVSNPTDDQVFLTVLLDWMI